MVLFFVKVKTVLACNRLWNYCGSNNLCPHKENFCLKVYDTVMVSQFMFMVLCSVALMENFRSTEIS